ncbi:MAG: tyrosine-type recombinase/integrase [Tepidisphaeraceae bacterium]
MTNVFRIQGRDGKRLANYYGKVCVAPGRWHREKLYTDKLASERRLRELQIEADRRQSGANTSDTERLARPLSDLIGEYFDSLRQQNRDADHLRISRWMTDKLIGLTGWQYFRDISRESLERALATLESEGATASYRNKFIARAKALTNHLLPEGWPNPIKRVRRVSEKNAKRTRERRAATQAELDRLLALDTPADRRLAYALAAYNGLRRNEAAGLTWERLHLSAPIPFISLGQKMGESGAADAIPLHPFVVALLRQRPAAMPGVRVLRAVPDVATLEKDWTRAGVAFNDAQERRLDFHALRHTFQTNLDRTGCSRATKKKLMRHAGDDVTDGYAHAELAEMQTALSRLATPDERQNEFAIRTGTSGEMAVSESCDFADHRSDQGATLLRRYAALSGNTELVKLPGATASATRVSTRQNRAIRASVRDAALPDLIVCGDADNVVKTGPSTQAD